MGLPTVFVMGCQRTGSTLMSMILGSHPYLENRGDVDLPEIMSGGLSRGDVLHSVIWTARYKLISQTYPDAKFVFMLRNIYAVVNSMMELGWADHFAISEVARAILGISNWYNQYSIIPYLGKACHNNDILKIATMCAYLKSYMLREYHEHGLDVYPIRYEELVSSPTITTKALSDFLGIEWHEDLLAHHRIYKDAPAYAGNDPKRPIDEASVDKWRSVLSNEQRETISVTVEEMDDIFYGFAHSHDLAKVS